MHREHGKDAMKRYEWTAIPTATRGTTVYGPKGSSFMDRECSNRERVLPFRSATGAHKEGGHLF